MEKKAAISAGKRTALTTVKMCAVLLASICSGTILMYAVYLLPISPIERHLKESIPVFQREGPYPKPVSWCSSTLDNFTDALMLLTAAYNGEESTLDKAMSLYYETSSGDVIAPVPSILDYGSETRSVTIHTYTRYWQGYLIFLKPLLSVMNYQQIRILNQIFQTGIVLLLIFLLKRSGRGRFILPLLLTLGLLPIIVNAQSLTYSDVFCLSMGGSCVLVLKWEKWRNSEKLLFFFLVLGIMTSFFDFLTYPLVSFGIPVCLYFCIERDGTFWRSLKTFVSFGIAWGLGYAGMWAGKWVAASVLTGREALKEGVASVLFRSGASLAEGEYIPLSNTILRNVGEWVRNPCFILFWLFCVTALLLLMRKNRFEALGEHLIFLLIACLPFAWYIVVRNHSYIHYFFTYKEMVIFAFAIMCFFTKSFSAAHEEDTAINT